MGGTERVSDTIAMQLWYDDGSNSATTETYFLLYRDTTIDSPNSSEYTLLAGRCGNNINATTVDATVNTANTNQMEQLNGRRRISDSIMSRCLFDDDNRTTV